MNLQISKQSNTLLNLFVDSEGLKNENDLNNCLYSIAKQTKPVDLIVLYNTLTTEEIEKLNSIIKNPVLKLAKKQEDGTVVIEDITLLENEKLNAELIKTSADNFSKVFNTGFNYANSNGYEYYSLTEQEDSFAIYWFNTALIYFEENPNISIFTPLIRNNINGIFSGIIGEAAFVEGLAEEFGIYDIALLLRYNVINPLGAIYKVSSIKENSEQREDGLYYPYKESIKITHSYEFFLRMVYNDLKIKVVPRIGYELKLLNKQSFQYTSSKIPQNIGVMPIEKGGINPKELQFFLDLAKKEYFFDKDRNIAFN